MKNRKLYESIQKLVTKKQSKRTNKANFAQQYCNEQLRRKKLLPKQYTHKIDEIMQKFKKIQTFVNVDELISCVNEIYIEENRKNIKQFSDSDKKQNKTVHRKHASQILDSKILGQAKLALKQYYEHLYELQNFSINPVLNQLQRNSNFLNDTIQNKQKDFIYENILKTERKVPKQDDCPSQRWNCYRKVNNIIKTQPNQQHFISNHEEKLNSPFDAYKKKRKLFNLAQIYLHMILEQKHRKKWNKSKKTNPSQNIRKTKFQQKTSKQKIQQQNILSVNEIKKSQNQNNEIKEKQQQNSTGSTWMIKTRTPRSLKSKVIKNKQIILKKVNNFLVDLEQDDECLKKQNKFHIRHLDFLQKRMGQEKINNFNSVNIWNDQEKCQQINKILYRQASYKI